MQDLLDKEKEDLKETKKTVADLNEDLRIAEERTTNAIAEKEKFNEKNREYLYKI